MKETVRIGVACVLSFLVGAFVSAHGHKCEVPKVPIVQMALPDGTTVWSHRDGSFAFTNETARAGRPFTITAIPPEMCPCEKCQKGDK